MDRKNKRMNMKQVGKDRFSWRLAVALVVFISMVERVSSQSSNRNNTLIRYYCSNNHGLNPTYFLSNLNTTLSSLRKQLSVDRLNYAIALTLLNGEAVWGLASCEDYVSNANCVACYDFAVTQLKVCGLGNGAHAFCKNCTVRYDNENFYTEANVEARVIICGNTTSPQPTEFRKTAESLLSDLRTAAPRTSNFYAASMRRIVEGNGTVYAIAKCNLNLTQSVCQECLKSRYSSLDDCLPSYTGWTIDNGCSMRYSVTPFFGQNQTTDISSLLWDGDSRKNSIIIGVVVVVSFLWLVLAIFIWHHGRSKKTGRGQQDLISLRGRRDTLDALDLKGAVIYNYKHLELATNNFSEKNIIGKGGFGEVFKAILNDTKVVAVKKLKTEYVGAKVGFENEILLISHIRHRNLLRLLGWCCEVTDLLLVLEYMPNGSLDKFLWGAKRGTLNWKQRYDIILGISKGLVHLHQEFNVKIVHRDIKSSNILLDDDFQPKIADFGLARFQPEDQSHVITKFAGTLGYTAPEYALYGFLSDKVDTFSFGIVILEIISGRKCNYRNFDGPSTDCLLEHAWKLYENKEHMKLVDETMGLDDQYIEEHVMKIIEIALLCTQSPVSKRPTMSEVVFMLSNNDPALGEIQLSRPNFIDLSRRIQIGSS